MTPSPSHRRDTPAPPPASPELPADAYVLDRASVRAVDQAAIGEYGIPGIVLMENASRGLASHALVMVGPKRRRPRTVLIVCGSGNNGGDGYALARHLHNERIDVVLAALRGPDPASDAGVNHAICARLGVPVIEPDRLDRHAGADLVVDAIFGTGLDRPVHGAAAEVIEWINRAARPVLAVDVPSGLDCDTGRPLGVTVRATRTVTFVGLKPGFLELEAQPFVGEVHVAGIGAPRELLERFGRPLPPVPPAPPDRPAET
ncbi:MAG: NAD(P)H-hydrate epimerase [Planctomycetota bacterium]|jgi:NAD(P)H-hydrate epimerase